MYVVYSFVHYFVTKAQRRIPSAPRKSHNALHKARGLLRSTFLGNRVQGVGCVWSNFEHGGAVKNWEGERCRKTKTKKTVYIATELEA